MSIFNRKSVFSAAFMFALAVPSLASANELLVTPAQSKAAGAAIALDIVSDGNISGFQFALDFGKAKLAKMNLSRCLSELPSSFAGECRQVGSKVYVIAMANQMVTLPEGIVSIGSISTAPSAEKANGSQKRSFVITDLEFVGVKGNVLKADSKIAD